MNIVIFEVEAWESESFLPLQDHHEVTFVQDPLTAENVGRFSGADIIAPFIYSDLKQDVLKQMRRLKLIATRSTGFDHIDTDFCEQNGIQVCNVPSYGENTVAENTFGLLLTLSHRLTEAIDRTPKTQNLISTEQFNQS